MHAAGNFEIAFPLNPCHRVDPGWIGFNTTAQVTKSSAGLCARGDPFFRRSYSDLYFTSDFSRVNFTLYARKIFACVIATTSAGCFVMFNTDTSVNFDGAYLTADAYPNTNRDGHFDYVKPFIEKRLRPTCPVAR